MSVITICTIHCDCEKGTMFKTAIKDADGKPAMFAIVRGTDDQFFEYNTLVVDGYCNFCGRRFQFAALIESFLVYKEAS